MSDGRTDEGADELLIAELRRVAAAADAAPPLLAESARAAFGFGRLDLELAELVRDTALQPVGQRGPDEPRLIAFAGDGVSVDVEVSGDADDRRLTGVVEGPVTAITVETPRASYDVAVDAQGRFRAAQVEGTLLRLVLTTQSGRGVTTPWVRLGR